MKLGKWLLIGVIIVAIAAMFIFKDEIFNQPPKVEIGEVIPDLGREHITDIFGVTYNSNPPTSGPHFPIWAKKGVYDRLLSDGYLIHSLEHGYVNISYDCAVKTPTASIIKTVLAHDEPLVTSPDSKTKLMHMNIDSPEVMRGFTPESQPAVEVELPEEFKSEECQTLVNNLKVYLNEAERLVIVPRVDMDTKIALTAWGRILKLDNVDDARIKEFIKTYHNKGPEKTRE